MSYKDTTSVQLVPLAAPPVQALPALSVSAGTTLTQVAYRDVAAARISPSGPTSLPDPDGFNTIAV
jgi:hypothetical protein